METLARAANRGSIATGGYEIDNSLKFEEDNLELLYKTFSGEGTGAGRTFTISTWCKRTELGGIDIVFGFGRDSLDYGDGGFRLNSDQLQLVSFAQSGGTHSYNIRSTAVFRDTSAWYHFMASVDTTQGTASNRVRLYVNGTEITDFTTSDYPAQNFQWKVGRAEEHMIGNRPDTSATEGAGFSTQNFSGYMAEFYFVDGQALAPTDFGEFDADTGIWKPIQTNISSYGTNGFQLKFDNASDLGEDTAGGSSFTLNNITSADQATDTPTNNFATFNPLIPSADMSFSNGATDVTSTAAGWDTAFGSIGVSTGKWYFEYIITATDGSQMGGVADEADIYTLYSGKYVGESANSVGYYGNDGIVRINGSTVATYNTYQQIPTMSIALDLDNGKVYFRRYDTWQGSSDPVNGTNGITLPTGGTGTWFFAQSSYFASSLCRTNHGGFTTNGNIAGYTDANGYGNFAFAPPSGYYALCSKNLAEFG
jgi:hypothetical protein